MGPARELPLAPLDSPKRSAYVRLWVTASDLKNRVHLRIQLTHLCEGISKQEAPEVVRTSGALLSLRRVSRPRGDERLRRRERRRIGDPSISPHLLFGQRPIQG
jgi:hypothetical protein